MRRFTTNALPTLSPIGQQRRQAAGDTHMVSPNQKHCTAQLGSVVGGRGMGSNANGTSNTDTCDETDSTGLRNLVLASLPSPGGESSATDLYGKGKAGAIGEERARIMQGREEPRKCLLHANNEAKLRGLIAVDEKSTLLNRPTPVSPLVLPIYFLYLCGTDREQSERRIRELQSLLEQQRSIAAELTKFDDETRREVEQGLVHERAVSDMIAQSEPTTPPEEYHDIVPSMYDRAESVSNRLSVLTLSIQM